MHDDDPDRPSSEQAGWVKLAGDLRDRLDELVDDVPGMEPAEAAKFVDACQGAFWLSYNAATFDKRVELEKARILPAD